MHTLLAFAAIGSAVSKLKKVPDFGAALGIFVIAVVTTALQLKR